MNRTKRNMIKVEAVSLYSDAFKQGTFTDLRVVEALDKLPPSARKVVLNLEARLGRKLSRERMQKLVVTYKNVVVQRQSRDAVRRFLADFDPFGYPARDECVVTSQ